MKNIKVTIQGPQGVVVEKKDCFAGETVDCPETVAMSLIRRGKAIRYEPRKSAVKEGGHA